MEEKYLERLRLIQEKQDIENRHIEADQLLCDLLAELGYDQIVKQYDEIEKWHA